MHKMKKRSQQARPHNPATSSAASLASPIPPAALLPPNCGILWTVQHLGQFFPDFHQPVGSHFHCRLIDLTVCTLPREPRVHVPQIRDFLTKAGEVFQDVWHRFNLTPDSGSSRHFFRPNQQSSPPVPSLPAISMTLLLLVARWFVASRAMARTPWQEDEPNQRKRNMATLDLDPSTLRTLLPSRPLQTARPRPDRTLLDNSKLTSYN